MKENIIKYVALALFITGLSACSQDEDGGKPVDAKHTPMTFDVTHPAQRTRVTATNFEDGDKIGVFVSEADVPLEIGGGAWTASRTLYWDEGTFNAYAYYPYTQQVSSIEDQPFSVSTDQGTIDGTTGLDGYEASDFLYAKTEGVSASNSPVPLTFKGEDFEGDMPTDGEVYIHNTVPTATIDMSAGVATRYVRGTRATIKAKQDAGTMFSAIVVPQRVENRMPLIEVIMRGVSYVYESKFQFKPGTNHFVNFVISDNPDQVKIEVGGEIEDWQ